MARASMRDAHSRETQARKLVDDASAISPLIPPMEPIHWSLQYAVMPPYPVDILTDPQIAAYHLRHSVVRRSRLDIKQDRYLKLDFAEKMKRTHRETDVALEKVSPLTTPPNVCKTFFQLKEATRDQEDRKAFTQELLTFAKAEKARRREVRDEFRRSIFQRVTSQELPPEYQFSPPVLPPLPPVQEEAIPAYSARRK